MMDSGMIREFIVYTYCTQKEVLILKTREVKFHSKNIIKLIEKSSINIENW